MYNYNFTYTLYYLHIFCGLSRTQYIDAPKLYKQVLILRGFKSLLVARGFVLLLSTENTRNLQASAKCLVE